MLNEGIIFLLLLCAGSIMLGIGMGAYIQTYYTQKALVMEHHRYVMEKLGESDK